jgi:hypothetical protein
MRARYIELRTVLPELPILARLASRDDIGAALFAWESEKANSGRLIEIADSDATSMLGFNGPNVLRKCVRFVLVPAATSIVNEVGTTSKGSALAELVGALTIDASTDAKDAWSQRHASALSELVTDIQSSVEGATAVQESRINSRLARLVPNASVRLTTVVPDFAPKINAATATAPRVIEQGLIGALK